MRKSSLKKKTSSKKSKKRAPKKALKATHKTPRRFKKIISHKLFKKIELQHKPTPVSESQPAPDPRPYQPASTFQLPKNYGDNKMALLVRDPWWLFTYWEVTEKRQAEVIEAIRHEGLSVDKTVLRVYEGTAGGGTFFDIEVGVFTDNWYIDVGKPDREWVAELGVRTREGRFFAWVRSNKVRTPRAGVSDVLDEEWLLPDEIYWKLFGLSGGLGNLRSSMDLRMVSSSPLPRKLHW